MQHSGMGTQSGDSILLRTDNPSALDHLRRQLAAAEAANAAKSRFLVSVSHELRSPLNAIYGYAQLLERGEALDPSGAGRIIRRSAEHLAALIDGLSDIAEVENGVLRVDREAVQFGAFLDQIADMFRPQAAAKGLRFDYERPQDLPQVVRMDQNRLRQVLINLLSNAIKFTPSGTVGLRVSYSGQIAVFEIEDTGPGIAADDHERIFVPFDRGTGTQAAAQPGSGLGLAITQALVRILGGDLSLDSAPGRGSRFRVTLMIGHVAGRIGAPAPDAAISGYQGPRRTILVVDDDADHLAMVRMLLEPLGFAVLTAPDGAAALAIAGRESVDLVLLDIAMPGLSGWQVAEQLGRNPGPRPVIVMVSGNVSERLQHDGEHRPHDHFLTKPVALTDLIDVIGVQLKLRWETTEMSVPARLTADIGDRSSLPEAARPHLEKLEALLRIGHVRGVEQEIKQLAAAAPDAKHLVARLFDGLDRYDFAAMTDALEEHR
jgi:CheY-like chemotaxis protein